MIKIQTVELPVDLGIRTSVAVHAQLLDALSASNAVVLDIPAEAEIDLSFLQLVQSARLTANRQAKAILLKAPIREKHRTILERAGMMPAAQSEDAAFWLHERT